MEDNIIYVNYLLEGDFIDLSKQESYITGRSHLNDIMISTYKKSKIDISEFKLYLIKNKNKFTSNISKIIDLI